MPVTLHRSRRLAGILALLWLAATPAMASDSDKDSGGLATLDWTLAETLMALEAPPRAVAQVDAYHDWVGQPRLADRVIDLGLRSQPNLELLAQLGPSHILISSMFTHLAPRLSQVGDVDTFSLYTLEDKTWDEAVALTHALGKVTGRPAAADSLVEETAAHIESLRQGLSQDLPALLIIQFMDERHVRVFGEHSLYQAVLERLELENAWQEQTNAWGFSLVGLEHLITLDAQLVVIEPYPTGVEMKLRHSALWQHLSSVRDDTLITLPAVWSFGALPSASRFAELLAAALAAAPEA
ncbi:ABC transporter substrate-binding protein [Billgrantia montanilacus]|uniref:Iron-siderophore ABC transporter substrate-binding protein n=1 Tax=Billgrantia montanilacus TaxID=2282305 RepID=A0A368TRS6_9GAMM|nr:ABC transporter substrate-binding protein [Halomonas montanilacus]RCV87364.1 iron-siderophore ABC transporter substrate-binding protein [Halomonas montanilacus]